MRRGLPAIGHMGNPPRRYSSGNVRFVRRGDLEHCSPGALSFDREKNFDAALVSKAMLSRSIEELLATMDRQEPLWNMDDWTAAPGSR